ncbi:MAG: GtrA family protein [Lachnospiraceae bacterium]|nr:GtrA family protein [Lachnospiraceae bacterium]
MKLIDKTTVKFLIVGVINTLVGTSVMFLLYNLLHANYWVSTASNYIIGSIVSYFLNKYFTFQNKEKSLTMIVKFVINISICYLFAYGIAKPLVRLALSGMSVTIQENMAMLVGMVLFVALNYIGQRFMVFKPKNTE